MPCLTLSKYRSLVDAASEMLEACGYDLIAFRDPMSLGLEIADAVQAMLEGQEADLEERCSLVCSVIQYSALLLSLAGVVSEGGEDDA